MAILKTSKLGNPILRCAAKEVSPEEINTAGFQNLIDSMIKTMREYDGVGLAAPQIHESRRIAVAEVAGNSRYPHAGDLPLLVLINPVFIEKSDETIEGWEGCLSIKGLRGMVPRSRKVSIRFLDREGIDQKLDLEEFSAVVIQHELDHLDGKVFLDRMADLSTLTHLKEFDRFWLKTDEDSPDGEE